MGRPEQAAERVLECLRIDDPKDLRLLEEIAYERGAVVREKVIQGAEARLTMVGNSGIITLSSTITHPQRRRFSIAHELGHFEMHNRFSSLLICTTGDLDDWKANQTRGNREQEANAFAAALLMPQRFFEPECLKGDPSLNSIQKLAHQFDTSLTATAIRYVQFSEEPIAVVFTQNGVVRWFRRSKEFEELGAFVEVRSRLNANSVASSVQRQGSGTGKQRRVRLSSWLSPGNFDQDALLIEQSWALSGYNSILTLLWIDEDVNDDDYYWSV